MHEHASAGQGLPKPQAVRDAALTRLRPILMTTAARNSTGLVLVGGMFVGTLFTLFVVPSINMLVAREHGAGAGD